MGRSQLGHLTLHVSDLERSVGFYTAVVGLTRVELHPSRRGLAVLTSGTTHHDLALVQSRHETANPGVAHIGFRVGESDDDLIAALHRVRSAGLTLLNTADHAIVHSAYVKDPDGNTVELFVDVPGVDWPTTLATLTEHTRPLTFMDGPEAV